MVFRWMSVLIVFFSLPAYALDFAEFGGLGFSFPSLQSNTDPSLGASPGLGFGGGATFGLKIWNRFYFEPGFFIMVRSFSEKSNSLPQTGYQFLTVQIPFIVRYQFSEKFSFGAGGYLAHGVGNLSSSQGSQSNIRGFNDLAMSVDDLGVLLSVRYQTPLNEVIQLVLDERLMIGTSNLDTTEEKSFQFRELQSLVGVLFNL